LEQSDLPFDRKTRADEIFNQFEKYHRQNPQVWVTFCYFTEQMRKKVAHYSARGVFDRIRWESITTTDEEIKIPNNFSPYYARMYLVTHPEAEGFFKLHQRFSQKRDATGEPSAVKGVPADEEEELMDKLLLLAFVHEPKA
jgi:hypothetical protein